jgi:hypothetical protein
MMFLIMNQETAVITQNANAYRSLCHRGTCIVWEIWEQILSFVEELVIM